MVAVSARPKLKTSYQKRHVIAPLHTSGAAAVLSDGARIITCVGEEALLTDVRSGTEICRFEGDTQTITSLCVTPSSSHLVLFTSIPSLRIYELPTAAASSSKRVSPIRVIARAHDAPVHVCAADPTSTYLASGSADGVVKVWDIVRGYVTHVFKGHGGVVSALRFNFPRDLSSLNRPRTLQLITGCVDTRIRIFDLSATGKQADSRPTAVLEGHVSVPRGLDVTSDGRWLLSGGRDSVVLIWDLLSQSDSGKNTSKSKRTQTEQKLSPVLVKTIPALERIEGLFIVNPDRQELGANEGLKGLQCLTAGEKGVIKVWDCEQGAALYSLGDEVESADGQEEQRQIVEAFFLPSTSTVVSLHADQNFLFYSLASRTLTCQLIGFNDEIVDAVFLSPSFQDDETSGKISTDSHIALATNSSLIRVYSRNGLNACLLEGHSEIVLSLARSSSGNLLASGSKDRTARVWLPHPNTSTQEYSWKCAAVCEGHAESIGAIAVSRGPEHDGRAPPSFMLTGSQDRTIKLWDLSSVASGSEEVSRCKSLTTQKAHDKDINSLDISPNDKLLASGSQDKTAKIYEIDFAPGSSGKPSRGEIKLLGTCKGHRRGVWSVKFSRAERVLATGSGDKTVKLWSLEDFSCVKTFEGHTNSVLRVDFMNYGMQLVSSASDGLVKLWSVREEDCTTTLDNHEDKVWALAISADERTILSAAADSVVTFWEDCTEEQDQAKEAKRMEEIEKEQDFQNYLALHDYRRAIELALAMQQPGRLLSLFKKVRAASAAGNEETVFTPPPSVTGNASVDQVIRTLSSQDLGVLLRFVRDWNTNAKTSGVAQTVLYAIMKLRSAEDILGAYDNSAQPVSPEAPFDAPSYATMSKEGTSLKDLVESMIPYTERHLNRMDRLIQESFVVDYILSEMDDGLLDAPDFDDTMDLV
ncbi:U3 small nucleolar RNA-associated protein [Coniophora puteana RWD-64-598 SS2]|uniref:U3 small nucleolar RNA-associated protein n=1 Tax=Coniophora puteana (strain RWD-64-598) TaxID=741705 RepID=A0A5M3N6U6_CONPW|nr:U3 small nucleolar RNA-associated protein [Coniophora puteana RWD-64-598 SS2]EIW86957.1 U3 small nucleolar RNA-associated protein [Coniophora puteana RWD-64-598 SS2]